MRFQTAAPTRLRSHVRFAALGGALAVFAIMIVAAARADDGDVPLSPGQALELLRQGNNRFSNGTPAHPNTGSDRLIDAARSTRPFAIVLTCADPRVPVERVFDRGFGDLYVVRNTGGLADRNAVSGIENGCAQMGAPLLVVLGHNRCATILAACTDAQILGITPQMVDSVRPAVEAAKRRYPDKSGVTLAPYVVEEQVWNTIRTTVAHSAEVQRMIKAGKLRVVGAVCEVETGEVRFLGDHASIDQIVAAGVQPWPDAVQVAAASPVPPAVPAPAPQPVTSIASSATTPIALPKAPATAITHNSVLNPRADTINPGTLMPESITSITSSASTIPPAATPPIVRFEPTSEARPETRLESRPPAVHFSPAPAESFKPPTPISQVSDAKTPESVPPDAKPAETKSLAHVARRTVAAEAPVAPAAPALPAARLIPFAYLAGALLVLIISALLALRLGKTADAHGVSRRAMTLGSKLAIAFGLTGAVICALGAVASRTIAADGPQVYGMPLNHVLLAAACMLALAACAVACSMLVRAVRPLRELRTTLVALAEGDMGVNPINSASRDEVGEAARCADRLAASVRDVLGEVTVSTAEVADAATRLNLSARQNVADSIDLARHSADADRLAAETRERAESCIIQLIASNAAQSQSAPAQPDPALADAADAVLSMQRQTDVLTNAFEAMNDLTDLADRADLLALNANLQSAKRSLGAARTFDPVADEARMLGQRLAHAAQRGGSDTGHAAVTVLRDRLGAVALQIKSISAAPAARPTIIPEAAGALKHVAEASTRLSSLIHSIAEATEKSSASANLAAVSAGELTSHADQLTAIVGRFKRTRDAAIDLSPVGAAAPATSDERPPYDPADPSTY